MIRRLQAQTGNRLGKAIEFRPRRQGRRPGKLAGTMTTSQEFRRRWPRHLQGAAGRRSSSGRISAVVLELTAPLPAWLRDRNAARRYPFPGFFDIPARVAIITGISRGIGFGLAQALLHSGCRVCICSRDLNGITATANRLHANVNFLEAIVLPNEQLSVGRD